MTKTQQNVIIRGKLGISALGRAVAVASSNFQYGKLSCQPCNPSLTLVAELSPCMRLK